MNPFTFKIHHTSLPAVFHPPTAKARNRLLVISHGFRGSKEGGGRAVALAEEAAGKGFAVLRYDFTPIQPLSRQVEELREVVAFCRQNIDSHILLLGRSMGGSASLVFAAEDGEIAGLCLWSTPWNLLETFQLSLGAGYDDLASGNTLHIDDQWGKVELTPNFIDDFSRFDLLASLDRLPARPLLVVHGDQDAIVPVHRAEELFARAHQPKQLAIIPGGDHQFISGGEKARQAVISWLDAAF